MDKRGSGLRRMVLLMEEAGLEKPVFEELPSGFRVKFIGGRKKIKETNFIIPDSIIKKLNLDKEHKKILRMIEDKGSVSAVDVTKEIKRSKPYAIKKLNELLVWDLLKSNSVSKFNPNRKYEINKDLSTKQDNLSTKEKVSQLELFTG
jgi:predicted HTH transcriptional regulator